MAVDSDPGSAIAAAVVAATASALAKATAAAEVTAAQRDKEAAVTAAGVAARDTGNAPARKSARFFVRGLGKLGEHHLQDYFSKFGEVVEAVLVRDKKTQRPRGMAFVTLVPTSRSEDEGCAPNAEELIDRITEATHTINGVALELQEALPKPEKEGEAQTGAEGAEGRAAADVSAAQEEEPPDETLDPAAQAQAQAQWQMHYLALAINASVPEVSAMPTGAKPKAAGGAPQSRGGGKGGGKEGGKNKNGDPRHGRGRGPY
mmetsp:Transcript_72247/g.182772  ORF Transcript_72247/g.182772 Transcript_72247/m.182772 type:complete len:261 (+) Transcript_72247:57-839(+)